MPKTTLRSQTWQKNKIRSKNYAPANRFQSASRPATLSLRALIFVTKSVRIYASITSGMPCNVELVQINFIGLQSHAIASLSPALISKMNQVKDHGK